MSEDEKKENGWSDSFKAIKRMHPFIMFFAVALATFFGYILNSNLSLTSKLTFFGATAALQVIAASFEAYRINQKETHEEETVKRLFS